MAVRLVLGLGLLALISPAQAKEYNQRPFAGAEVTAGELRLRAIDAMPADAGDAPASVGQALALANALIAAAAKDGDGVAVSSIGGHDEVSGDGHITSHVVVGRSVNIVVGKGMACTEIGGVGREDVRCKRIGGVPAPRP